MLVLVPSFQIRIVLLYPCNLSGLNQALHLVWGGGGWEEFDLSRFCFFIGGGCTHGENFNPPSFCSGGKSEKKNFIWAASFCGSGSSSKEEIPIKPLLFCSGKKDSKKKSDPSATSFYAAAEKAGRSPFSLLPFLQRRRRQWIGVQEAPSFCIGGRWARIILILFLFAAEAASSQADEFLSSCFFSFSNSSNLLLASNVSLV